MPTGKVKWYDSGEGIGFLTCDDGGEVAVDRSALAVQTLRPGQHVEFDLAEGGVRAAVRVRVLEQPLAASTQPYQPSAMAPAPVSQSLIDRLLSGLGLRKLDVRGQEVASFASKYGLWYEPDPFGGVRMPGVPRAGGFSRGRMKNQLTGQWRGLPVWEVDSFIAAETFTPHPSPHATHVTHQVKSAYTSFLQADLAADLPELMIRSKVTLIRIRSGSDLPGLNIHIGSAEFNRMFEVATADTTFAAKLLDAKMIEWLLSTGGEFTFMLQKFPVKPPNKLLIWCPLLPTTALERVFDAAKDFTDRIPHQVWAEYGTG